MPRKRLIYWRKGIILPIFGRNFFAHLFFCNHGKKEGGRKGGGGPIRTSISCHKSTRRGCVLWGNSPKKTTKTLVSVFKANLDRKIFTFVNCWQIPCHVSFFPLAKEGKKPSGEKGKRRKVTVAEKRRTTKLLRKLHLSSCKSFPPSAAKSRVSSSLLLLLLLFQKKSGEGKTFLPRSRQWKASSSFWIKKPSPFLDNIFHGDGRPPSFSQTFARRRLFLRY